ncbi:protein S-acyltransferase [Ranunculus cassubicifolius]
MGFTYYSTLFIFMAELKAGLINALLFTFFVFMCLLSFILSVVTDPGQVPSTFLPDIEDQQQLSVEEQQQQQQASSTNSNVLNKRYCDKCSAYKPPRSHHCRVCKRCVLRMDHHCLWINNCVGLSNYKPFLIFILYAAICCIYSMVVTTSAALQKDWESSGQSHLKYYYIGCGSTTGMFCFVLVSLFVWNLYLVAHNMTTIEHHEGVRAKWLARKSGQTYHHPFDMGLCNNLKMILGPSKLKWLCPTALGHLRDETNFPTSRSR